MIITAIISAGLLILAVVLGFIPAATSLPFGIDGALAQVGVWIVQIQLYVWPLQIVFRIFFLVYVPFLVVMLFLKFFLGHRAPGRDVS